MYIYIYVYVCVYLCIYESDLLQMAKYCINIWVDKIWFSLLIWKTYIHAYTFSIIYIYIYIIFLFFLFVYEWKMNTYNRETITYTHLTHTHIYIYTYKRVHICVFSLQRWIRVSEKPKTEQSDLYEWIFSTGINRQGIIYLWRYLTVGESK